MKELKLDVLLEERTGDTVTAVCRRRGISRETFYVYRRRYQAEQALRARVAERPLAGRRDRGSAGGRLALMGRRLPRRPRPLPTLRARLPDAKRGGRLGLLRRGQLRLRPTSAAALGQPPQLHRAPVRRDRRLRAQAGRGRRADQRRTRAPADARQAGALSPHAQGVARRRGAAEPPRAAAGSARALPLPLRMKVKWLVGRAAPL